FMRCVQCRYQRDEAQRPKAEWRLSKVKEKSGNQIKIHMRFGPFGPPSLSEACEVPSSGEEGIPHYFPKHSSIKRMLASNRISLSGSTVRMCRDRGRRTRWIQG